MEEVLASVIGRTNKPESGQQIQDVDTASKHEILRRNVPRKKSMFTLASEFFKLNRPENVEIETGEHEQHERNKGQWNPFASLRGLKDTRKRTEYLSILRGSVTSPQSSNEPDTEEHNTPKTMRRKSLQDLLETMGNKLSIARRLVYNEDTIKQLKAPINGALTASRETSQELYEISPLVLPEPALPIDGVTNALPGSQYPYTKEVMHNKLPGPPDNLVCQQEFENLPSNLPSLDREEVPSTLTERPQVSDVTEIIGTPRAMTNSQQLGRMLPLPPPEELRLAATIISQDIDPQVTTNIKSRDETDSPPHKYKDDFEDDIILESRNVDHFFPDRVLRREARYISLWDKLEPKSQDSSTTDVPEHIASTAVRVSKNLYHTNIKNRWSMDSSDTDTNSMSDYNWAEKEMECRDVIERGRGMMKLRGLSPHLHSNVPQMNESEKTSGFPEDRTTNFLAANEAQPESPGSLNLTLQTIDKLTGSDINLQANLMEKRLISLENGERLRPRRTSSRLVSIEPVHIVYPPNEFREAQTKTYTSKSSAFGDLYQNHSGYSDYCLFDRSTRTYYPQDLSYSLTESSLLNHDNLEVVWLPLEEIFPADPLIIQTNKGDGDLIYSNESNSRSDRPLGELKISVKHCTSTLVPTALNKAAKNTLTSGNNVGASSDNSENQSIYSGALISIREISGPFTESLSSDDQELMADEVDDPYKISVDPTKARLRLRSQFSSTDTLRSNREDIFASSSSAQSSIEHLKEEQEAESKKVRTWFDMERDFLNRFAPGSHLSHDRRGRIAVSEALKKLKSLAKETDEKDFDGSGQVQKEEFEIEHIEIVSCSEASTSFDLEPMAAASSEILRVSSENVGIDSSSESNTKGKGRETFALPQFNYMPSVKSYNLPDCFMDIGMSPCRVDQNLLLTEDNTKNICQSSSFAAMDSHRRLGSGESLETDDTPITMLSGYMFTHYAEQLGQLSEASQEEEEEEEEEIDRQSVVLTLSNRHADVSSLILVGKDIKMTPLRVLPQIKQETGSDKIQRSVPAANENGDLVSAMTTQDHQCPSQSGLAQLMLGRSTSTSSETSSDVSFLRPRSTMPERVLTPNKRSSTPLVEILPRNSHTERGSSPTPSKADTEASDNFGEKLEKYRCIEEEEKENDFWWTESISYG